MSLSKRLIAGGGDNPSWMGIAEYTGNTGTRTFSGLSNSPDLLMFQSVDSGYYSCLVSKAYQKMIYYTSANSAIGDWNTTNVVNFTDDGFTIPTNTYTDNSQVGINKNGVNWKVTSFSAGDGFVTNNVGSVTTQVNANPDMGFSIVKWTGGGDNTSYGHGLSSQPRVIITQRVSQQYTSPNWRTSFRDSSNNWKIGNTSGAMLRGDNYGAAGAGQSNGNSANSTRFYVGTDDDAGGDPSFQFIAYIFTDIALAGTKFFQLAGNSDANQRTFGCGFDPKLLWTYTNDVGFGAMMNYKMASSGSSSQWTMTSYNRMNGGGVTGLSGSINFDNSNNRIEILTTDPAYNKLGHNYLNLAFGSDYMEEMTVS